MTKNPARPKSDHPNALRNQRCDALDETNPVPSNSRQRTPEATDLHPCLGEAVSADVHAALLPEVKTCSNRSGGWDESGGGKGQTPGEVWLKHSRR